MLKPKIFINLLQLLCIVVSVAQTGEFDRFQWWVLRWRWLVLHVCAFSGLQNTLETQINLCVWFDLCEDRRLNQSRSTAPALSNWFRHRISHELNSLNSIPLMWSTMSELGLKYLLCLTLKPASNQLHTSSSKCQGSRNREALKEFIILTRLCHMALKGFRNIFTTTIGGICSYTIFTPLA